MHAPYITTWNTEKDPPATLVERFAYQDETVDRDRNGVLWRRTQFAPGDGRPEFGKVHSLRQRRPSWQDGMGITEPPICAPCVATSIRLCPALRDGAVAVRAQRFPVAGVHGALYGS